MKTTILIVDDTPRNLQVLGNLLRQNNYGVEFALDGKAAIDWVNKKQFDLILLDVMMPGMDGFQVASFLKENTSTRNIPIIFLTAKNDEESIIKGFNSGGVDYITKPFNQNELLVRISNHLALKFAQEKINQQNREITKSIESAKQIQDALLPLEQFKTFFPKSFLINLPRDNVSGDFYWVKKHQNKIFFTISDCTGHGVPGALMSMLGISILNEVNGKANDLNAANVLDHLRDKIKQLFTLGNEDKKEGMDMAFCIWDIEKRELHFAGAMSNLFFVRDNTLEVISGDRQPVASYYNEKPFTNHIISLKKKDRIYLSTDGFIDQFGGEKGRKLMPKNFRAMILETQDALMLNQSEKVNLFLTNWMQGQEQIDDILMAGIEF